MSEKVMELQRAITDDAEASVVLKAVRWCAKHWQPEARIIGNVRAGDIARSIEEYADKLAACQVENERLRTENAALKRDLIKSVEHGIALTAALLPFAEADDHMHERCHGLIDRPSLDDRAKWCREYVGLKHFHDARAALSENKSGSETSTKTP